MDRPAAGSDIDFIETVARVVASPQFAYARDKLTDGFYDKVIKERVIHELRTVIASPAMDVPADVLEYVNLGVIQQLVGLASKAARRPHSNQEAPPVLRSPEELQRMILGEFPRPIAVCYHELAEAEPGAEAFGPLLDTFESLINFLATVLISAYWRDGAPNTALNERLVELFRGRAWSLGTIMEFVRETARIYQHKPDALPYPQLIPYLFKHDGLAVLDSFVQIRNSFAHATGRTGAFLSEIFPDNRKRLDEELNRYDWLTTCSLWLPKRIDDGGQIRLVDKLDGNARIRNYQVSFQIDQKDLFRNGPHTIDGRIGDIVSEKSLILVHKESGTYLPLFPLSRFLLRLPGEGTFFLNHLVWQGSGLQQANYVTYDLARSLDPEQRRYAATRDDHAVMLLEAHVQKLQSALPIESIEKLLDAGPRRADYDIAGVWHEQQFHHQNFVGREAALAKLSDWANSSKNGEYFLLLGFQGQGKSALLSEFAYREKQSGCLLHLIKSQSDPRRILQFLLWQTAKALGEDIDPTVYASDVSELRNVLQGALDKLARTEGRALLVIDGLDELPPSKDRLAFLPESLPSGVKVVLSSQPGISIIDAIRVRCRPLEEWRLPALAAQDLPLFLEKYLGRDETRRLAHSIDFDFLFRRMGGNPMFLRYALERILADIRAGNPIDPATLPDSADPFCARIYDEISERSAGAKQSDKGRLKSRIFQFLAVARQPLTIEELSDLLKADGVSLWQEEIRDLLMEVSRYLLSTGDGFKPCYDIVAEFVTKRILGEAGRALVHGVYCRSLASNSWRSRYNLHYYAWHLIKAGDIAGLVDLVRSDWIERHAEEFGLPAALEQTQSVVDTLVVAGPAQKAALFAAAEKYCDLLDAFRGDPKELIYLFEKDEPARVMSAIKAQRDPTLRAILLIGMAHLQSDSYNQLVALLDGMQELKRVMLQVETPQDWIRVPLMWTIFERREEWLALDSVTGEKRARPNENKVVELPNLTPVGPVRSRIPFFVRLLAALATPRSTYYLAVLFFAIVVFIGVDASVGRGSQGWLSRLSLRAYFEILAASIGFLILWLPAQWSVQRLLRGVKIDRLMFAVARYCGQEADVEKRKRTLDRLIRFANALVRAPIDRSSWEIFLPYLVIERFRLAKGDARSVATLVLASCGFGVQVTTALSRELRGLDRESITDVFREIRNQAYPGAEHVGTLTMMASLLDRVTEMDSFLSYLTFGIKTLGSEDRFNPVDLTQAILKAAPAAELGKLLLTSITSEPLQSHVHSWMFTSIKPWLSAPIDRFFRYPRPFSKFDSFIYFLTLLPLFVVTAPSLLIYYAPFVISFVFAGRIHDPYGLARKSSASTAAMSRSILSTLFVDTIGEPDFSVSTTLNRLRVPPNWILAPRSLRFIRETVYIQGILRQQIDENLQTTLSALSRRRIEYALLKNNLMGRELLPAVIGDRQLLNAVRKLPPAAIYQSGTIPSPSRDQAELQRALPLAPTLIDWGLVSMLSLALVMAWWIGVIWSMPNAPQSFWLFSFAYGGSVFLAICVVLSSIQHAYGLLAENYFGRLIMPKRSAGARALAYQLTLGAVFLVVFLSTDWSVLPVVRRMAANAGLLVPQWTTDDYLYPTLIPVLVVGLIVPSFIARWRGFGLLYPTKQQLWTQRLISAGVLLVVLSLLVVFTDVMLRRTSSAESLNFYHRGAEEDSAGHYDDALGSATKAIQFDPKRAENYRGRCITESNLRDFKHAEADCDKAIQLLRQASGGARIEGGATELVTALDTFSWTLLLAREPAEAAAQASEALNLDQSSLYAQEVLAIADLFIAKFEDAKTIVLNNRTAHFSDGRPFVDDVLDHFKKLREYGISIPEMNMIESLFAQ